MKKLIVLIMSMLVNNAAPSFAGEILPWGKLPKESGQLIHVQTSFSKSIQGKLVYYERKGPNWEAIGKIIPIVVRIATNEQAKSNPVKIFSTSCLALLFLEIIIIPYEMVMIKVDNNKTIFEFCAIL